MERFGKVVNTEHDETLNFNLLREHSDTTFYQAGGVNLTEEQCEQESVPYSAIHSDHFPREFRNFKAAKRFRHDSCALQRHAAFIRRNLQKGSQ